MTSFKTLDVLDAKGKIVLLRATLNVPVQNGKVTDATRIQRLVPTLQELQKQGARVVILSHFGRPKGRDAAFSLAPVRTALEKELGAPVAFADDCVGDTAKNAIKTLQNGQVLLLENVRFHPEETKNDPAFAQKMADLGDVYVNDAFPDAHRAHASTESIARLLPAYAVRLMEAELKALSAALENPERPVTAIVGGAKISTKLDLLNNLVTKIDTLVLGGGMANTFLHALGTDVGASLCEKDMADAARKIMETARRHNCRILLPVDGITAKEFRANAPAQEKDNADISADDMILDIGPKSTDAIKDVLRQSKTLLWNGPLGAFETPPFDAATMDTAKDVSDLTQSGKLVSIAGGGDTIAALAQAGTVDDMTYVSTAGGAFLEWLEGKELPGVAALSHAMPDSAKPKHPSCG